MVYNQLYRASNTNSHGGTCLCHNLSKLQHLQVSLNNLFQGVGKGGPWSCRLLGEGTEENTLSCLGFTMFACLRPPWCKQNLNILSGMECFSLGMRHNSVCTFERHKTHKTANKTKVRCENLGKWTKLIDPEQCNMTYSSPGMWHTIILSTFCVLSAKREIHVRLCYGKRNER